MKAVLKPIALAMLVATTQLAGVAYAQAPKASPAPIARTAPAATKEPIQARAPEDWIIYDDTTYTPVVDDVSRHLNAARKAFDAKDNRKAAAELRAVANELKEQSARATRTDKARAQAEIKLAQDAAAHMDAAAKKVNAAAAAIEAGKIRTRAELNKAIDKVARADMERRWLVADVTTWYPVSEEPQRHFLSAVEAFSRKDYKAAEVEIHKGAAYVRLEADRATGDARQALNGSVTELDKLAAAVAKGTVKDQKTMDKAFADADHALALEHRAKAAESWADKKYDQAGYELKASAHGLASAAGWVGSEAKTGAATAVSDGRALGDKLVAGGTWTRDEVAKGFESLGSGINALGKKIGSSKKASPFDAGA
jgi:hypothetical protein